MIETKDIASKRMKQMISVLYIIRRFTNKTLFRLTSNRKTNVFVMPKRKFKRSNDIKILEFAGLKTAVFTKNNPNNHYVIYLHGGGYLLKGKQNHHQFITDLNQELCGTILMVDYPTSNESTVLNTIEKTKDAIKEIMSTYKNAIFNLCGDSAGGGLALVVYKELLKSKNTQIQQLFLLSPWVDVSMSNPDIMALEKKEFMFTKEELISCANAYAGDHELTNQILSPIYGEGYNINNIVIYAGTRDILYPDILKFATTNKKIILYEFTDLPHVFPLFPSASERLFVISDIVSKIIDDSLDNMAE